MHAKLWKDKCVASEPAVEIVWSILTINMSWTPNVIKLQQVKSDEDRVRADFGEEAYDPNLLEEGAHKVCADTQLSLLDKSAEGTEIGYCTMIPLSQMDTERIR